MNEIEAMEKHLQTVENPVFIQEGRYLKKTEINELVRLYETYDKARIKRCFYLSKKNERPIKTMTCDALCSKCKRIEVITVSKTVLFEYLDCGFKGFICSWCKDVEQKKRQKQEDEKPTKEETTQEYINTYLNPEKEWNKEIDLNKKFSIIKRTFIYDVDFDIVTKYIQEMDYYDFLNTPYWKAVASYKRKQAGQKCELCNSKGILHVHHKTYENHGKEAHNLKDLIALCENCHEKFHDKEND